VSRRSALHFTPDEFQALLKEREKEERKRRAKKEEAWGTGWSKRAAAGSSAQSHSWVLRTLRRWAAALMGWLGRAPREAAAAKEAAAREEAVAKSQ
jgi:septal ring factor EnvC (AmiA/AmiB activator)